jgi:solute carrier family 35 protein F1/2
MSYALLWLLGGSNPRKGDAFVVAGATLYAVSNVSEVS